MSAVFKFHEWTGSKPEPPSAEKIGKQLIQLERVTKTYDSGENAVQALSGIDLQIDRGVFVSIIGPSGSGKSTLMHILGCLDTPSVILADEPTGNLDQKTGGEIIHLFEELAANGQTIILVTHDPVIAARTQRRIKIVDGLIADNDDMD